MYKENGLMSSENVISAMTEEMIGNGFFPDALRTDGKWHRFRQPGGAKNNVDSAYVLSINGESATGCYYSYRKQDEKFHFHYGKKQTFIEQFVSYPQADENHPYLVKKKIPSAGFKQDTTTGRLVIPMTSQTGEVCGLQLISADGSKTLAKGSVKTGSRLDLQGDETTIYICEGVATGFSVNQATGNKVIVGWDEGNLKHISPYVKEVYPHSKIVFAADNDATSTPNIGVQSAKRAAASIGAKVVIPENDGKKTDFNDLHVLLGLEEVKRQVEAGLYEKESTDFLPLTPQQTRVSGRLFSPPPMAEYILNIFGRPLIKKGIVFAIIGAGGSGKSFLTKKLLTIMASGEHWGPFSVPKKLNVLYLSGEDDLADIDRRLWDIQPNGKFSDGLHVASVVGQVGAFMEFGANGNPQVSKWRNWLLKTIQAHPGLDVLVIDPLSKFYGLSENSNENANAFIAMLQTLCVEIGTGLNICYVHHANKASMTEAGISKATSRGASAFRDGVRFEMTLKDIDQADAKRYSIDGNTRSYFKMDITKTNFAGEISDPIFFKKNPETGVPEFVDLKKDRLVEVSESFYDGFFLHNTPEKRRDLLRGKPVDLFDTIKTDNQDFKIKDMPTVLEYLLKEGAIEEEFSEYRNQAYTMIKVSSCQGVTG